VVLMKSVKKKWKSEKKLQKVKENIWLAQRREGAKGRDQLTVISEQLPVEGKKIF
jgi:hypothetical protein